MNERRLSRTSFWPSSEVHILANSQAASGFGASLRMLAARSSPRVVFALGPFGRDDHADLEVDVQERVEDEAAGR